MLYLYGLLVADYIIVIMLFYRFKKKKIKNTDFYEHGINKKI